MPDRFVLVLTLMCVLPSAAHAADGKEATAASSEHAWGINIWGLSYHVDRHIDYNETNWGIGVRYYATPPWKWLGSNPDNRVFLDADALRNSNRGLLLPLSVGAEYKLSQLFTRCKLFAVGAFTVAYYGNPTKSVSEVRLGPVPGLTIGCGHVKVNSMAVLGASRQPLVAITASMTVLF